MPNPRPLALSVVALAALIAAWVWATSDAAAKVPDGADPARHSDRNGADPARAATGGAAPRPNEPGVVRVTAHPEAAGDGVLLDVLLRVQVGNELRTAPHADVALRIAAEDAAAPDQDAQQVVARTDEEGRARFRLQGAEGKRAQLRSGLGGQAATTITDEGVQPLELVVPARVIARGSVLQTGSVAAPFADLLLLHWPYDAADPGQLWHIGKADHNGRFEVPLFAGGRIGASHPGHGDSAMFLVRPHRGDEAEQLPAQTFELLLASLRAPLSGLVVDNQGQPVPFAEVEARNARLAPSGAELAGPPRRTRCDDQGRFGFDRLGDGSVRWTARARGHGWHSGSTELTAGRPNELRIQLPLASSLTGRIVAGDDGAPAPGAFVTIGEQGTLAFALARTGPDGRYELPDLGTGLQTIRVRHDLGRTRAQLTLRPGEASTWDARLGDERTSSDLRGIVVDSEQQPIAGWRVVVRQKGFDPVTRVTDEGGRFEIPVERREGLDVRVFDPGRAVTSFADAMLRNQRTDRPVRLVVDTAANSSVVGRVLDSSATGVAAQVGCWHYERREYARYTADDDGRFRIPRVPLGTIDLTIEHPGHVAYESGAVEIARGLPVDLGSVHLQLGGGLYGKVVGPGGTAPPQCTLSLVQPGNGRELQAQYDGGGYRFRGIPPGAHTLLVRGEGIAGASVPVTIEAGVDAPLDLEVHQGLYRRILVRVPPGGGRRATLALRAAADEVRWMATGPIVRDGNGDGVATFETWMVAGSYEVVVGTDGGHQARETVLYAANGRAEVSLRTAPR